ncbi:MAG: hypothetical protein IPJ20_13365 [Flammeovirgaceae bacterium]|nr:hypothetical protein [Flammeovirgaceae bacterium]
MSCLSGQSQGQPVAAQSFKIIGEVKREVKISVYDLEKYRGALVKDVVITNHLGEVKSRIKKLTGVLLRDVLANVEIKVNTTRSQRVLPGLQIG